MVEPLKLDQLTEVVSSAEMAHHVVRQGRGAYVVLPRGARILGAWPNQDVDNIFWTADCCVSSESLASAVESGDWNLGGDRLWYSPELDLFVNGPQATGPEFVPSAIDPGSYDLGVDGDVVTMRQAGTIADGRHGVDIHFECERSVRPIGPPTSDLDGLDYIGYEIDSTIRARTDSGNGPAVNLWQLAQVPPSGEVLIPTYRRAEPYDFFSTGAAEWCHIEPDHIVFPITGESRHKLGLPSSAVTGRIGYLRKLSDACWSLFVRNMHPVPGGFYPDFPIVDPDRRCYAIECYNDGGQYGGFGEAEHHAPSVATGNTCHSKDVSQLWAFAGSPDAIRRMSSRLLGPAG